MDEWGEGGRKRKRENFLLHSSHEGIKEILGLLKHVAVFCGLWVRLITVSQ